MIPKSRLPSERLMIASQAAKLPAASPISAGTRTKPKLESAITPSAHASVRSVRRPSRRSRPNARNAPSSAMSDAAVSSAACNSGWPKAKRRPG